MMRIYESVSHINENLGQNPRIVDILFQKAYEYCQKTAERQMINLLMYTENEMLYPNISANSRVNSSSTR